MKLIVAGTRYFRNYDLLKTELDKLRESVDITEIVSGHCNGADKLGEDYARDHNLPIRLFKADWRVRGKSAGPLRNREMAMYADMVIVFWDGKSKGTKNIIEQARKNGLKIKIITY